MRATHRWLGALLLATSLPCLAHAQNNCCEVIWFSPALCRPLGHAPDLRNTPGVYGVNCQGHLVGPVFCLYPPFNPVGTFPPGQDIEKLPKLQKKKAKRCPDDDPKAAQGGLQSGPPPTPPGYGQPMAPANPGFGQPYPPSGAGLARGPMPGYPGQGQPGATYASYSAYRGPGYASYPVYPGYSGYAGYGQAPARQGAYPMMAQMPMQQASAVAGAYAEYSPFVLVQAPPTFTFPAPQTPRTPPMPQYAPPMPYMPRPPGSSALPSTQMTQPGVLAPMFPLMPMLPQTPQVRVAMPQSPLMPMPPVPPPAPLYMPQIAPGGAQGAPTHPYARSPRDFFMWNEVYENSANRAAQYPSLVR